MIAEHILDAVLSHPAPGFLCEDTRRRESKAKFRVPLWHVDLESHDPSISDVFRNLPDLEAIRQLHLLLADGNGIGLYAPALLHQRGVIDSDLDAQRALGAIIIPTPSDWPFFMNMWQDWFSEGTQAAFENLPYRFEDVIPLAIKNFSPDLWYIVIRGDMAGQIVYWGHDGSGDSTMLQSWAADVKTWAQRIALEVPSAISMRYHPSDSIDLAPTDPQLYPIRFLSDVNVPHTVD